MCDYDDLRDFIIHTIQSERRNEEKRQRKDNPTCEKRERGRPKNPNSLASRIAAAKKSKDAIKDREEDVDDEDMEEDLEEEAEEYSDDE
jgi:hypothetical protein